MHRPRLIPNAPLFNQRVRSARDLEPVFDYFVQNTFYSAREDHRIEAGAVTVRGPEDRVLVESKSQEHDTRQTAGAVYVGTQLPHIADPTGPSASAHEVEFSALAYATPNTATLTQVSRNFPGREENET